MKRFDWYKKRRGMEKLEELINDSNEWLILAERRTSEWSRNRWKTRDVLKRALLWNENSVVERERQRGFRAFRSRRMLTRGERVVASVRQAYHSFLSFFPFALDQVCERMGIKGNNLSGCECYSYFSVESLVSLTLFFLDLSFHEFFVFC